MKFKILRIGGDAIQQVRRFGATLIQDAYTEEKEAGFSISQLTSHSIHGRFLEKRTRRIQVFTITGEPDVVEVPSINVVKFSLHTKSKAIIVYDSNGSLSSFVSRLGSLAEYQLSVESADLPVKSWIKYFIASGHTLTVEEFTLAHMTIRENVDATIRLRGDVSVESVELGQFMDKKGDTVSVQLKCSSANSNFMFVWKHTGHYEIDPLPHGDDFLASFLDSQSFENWT